MIKISKVLFLVLLFSLSTTQFAIAQSEVEMADVLRSNGKIYAVVAVCLTILFGLIIYLFSLDKKLSKLEKDNSKK